MNELTSQQLMALLPNLPQGLEMQRGFISSQYSEIYLAYSDLLYKYVVKIGLDRDDWSREIEAKDCDGIAETINQLGKLCDFINEANKDNTREPKAYKSPYYNVELMGCFDNELGGRNKKTVTDVVINNEIE